MQIAGKMITCDRCNKKVFLKLKEQGELNDVDTTWDKFEKKPDGWTNKIETGDLCPTCTDKYTALINEFMSEGKAGAE